MKSPKSIVFKACAALAFAASAAPVVVSDAMRGPALKDVRLEGWLGQKMDRFISRRLVDSFMREQIFDEARQTLDFREPHTTLTFLGYDFKMVRDRLFGTGKRYLTFGPSKKSMKRIREKIHGITHARNGLLTVEKVVERLNRLTKGWGAFYSVGYPSKAFHAVNGYALRRMARHLNHRGQRRYRLKFADTYYGELNHYGMHWLRWADVRRRRY
jgi:hypothetical protein